MTKAETAVRRFYESLRTADATLVNEVLVPDAKTFRCAPIYLHLICGPTAHIRPISARARKGSGCSS